jgi:hypothetical protein
MWDLAEDENSTKLLESFLAAGKTFALVCHSSGALRHVKSRDGKLLVDGKTVTGFTYGEEEEVGLTKVVPFPPQLVRRPRDAVHAIDQGRPRCHHSEATHLFAILRGASAEDPPPEWQRDDFNYAAPGDRLPNQATGPKLSLIPLIPGYQPSPRSHKHAPSFDTASCSLVRAAPALRGYACGDRQELPRVRCHA